MTGQCTIPYQHSEGANAATAGTYSGLDVVSVQVLHSFDLMQHCQRYWQKLQYSQDVLFQP